MSLDEEIRKIFYENNHRMTVSVIMELVDELEEVICEEFSKELNLHYEEIQSKLSFAKRKIKEKIELAKVDNGY